MIYEALFYDLWMAEFISNKKTDPSINGVFFNDTVKKRQMSVFCLPSGCCPLNCWGSPYNTDKTMKVMGLVET